MRRFQAYLSPLLHSFLNFINFLQITMHLLPPNDQEFSVESRNASPANLLIKIESFSLLSKNGIREYESREFDAGGYKWKLIIGLVRELEGESGEGKKEDVVSVCLSTAATSSLPLDWEINAIFTFFLHNQISDNYLSFRGMPRRFNAVNPKWGFPKLISKKSLMDPSNGYVVNDNCVFGAEVFVIKRELVVECLSLRNATHPFKRDWKVSLLGNNIWFSQVFAHGGHNWQLQLHRNGSGAAKGTHISIFMNCVDCETFAPHQKVKAEITFRIKDMFNHNLIFFLQKKQENLNHFTRRFNHWFTPASAKGWGIDTFMPISYLRSASSEGRYVVDDWVCVETEISVQAVCT